MKAVVLTGLRQMEISDIAKPSIEKDTDVLLKMEKVGVCGSDVHYYETGRIGSQVVEYPFIVGHECSATVEAVGRGVTGVKVGDEMVVDPIAACHECAQCKMGRENTCYNLQFLGTPGQGDGCLREYIVMPQECCLPTNGAITLEQGALCEPLSIGVYSVKRTQMSDNAKVAILGSGPIGLSCMVAAKVRQAEAIYMTDKIPERMEVAKNAGADWVGNPEEGDIVKQILEREPLGVDVVYECAGEQDTLDEAIELLRPGGKLILIGAPRFERVSFVIDKLRRNEIDIINIRRQVGCAQPAIDLVACDKAKVDFMVTHRFDFERTRDAFEMVAEYRDGVVKAIVEF
ncbi:MAG: alcohol dehydrogenase catalytic domain-containing protein [Planctomycetota bacterium]|jgi:L-iditol 2-dehydrogenase